MRPPAMLGVMLLVVSANLYAAEVLQSISDNNAVPAATMPATQTDEDRIIYRVSCKPDDEALPDCEHSFGGHEPLLPTPDLPQDSEDRSEQVSEVVAVPDAEVAPAKVADKASVVKKPGKVASKVNKAKTKVKSSTSKKQVSSKGPTARKSSVKSKTKS